VLQHCRTDAFYWFFYCCNMLEPMGPLLPTFYKQELSYRKQIVRQLSTQYAEVIDSNSVTLKSRLRVTQCQWKRNLLLVGVI